MSMSIRPLASRQPITPPQRLDPLAARKTQEKEEQDAESLELEKQSIQDQLTLLKGTTDTASSPDVEKVLNERLEEINKQLQTTASSAAGQAAPRFDRYEHDENAAAPSAGLYRVEADELGNASVVFEPPTDPDADTAPSSGGKPEDETAQTTVNTDQVDQEIERLKEERAGLQQELQGAAGDESKEAQLKQQLAQLDAELKMKDNDTYRKQHASVTEG